MPIMSKFKFYLEYIKILKSYLQPWFSLCSIIHIERNCVSCWVLAVLSQVVPKNQNIAILYLVYIAKSISIQYLQNLATAATLKCSHGADSGVNFNSE